MANTADLLSLNKAKLVKRARSNHLGTKELVLDYHNQTGQTREESMAWLEANRLTLTDPTFSFKTYTGTWKCIEIAYNEDKHVIRQRFQIDSKLENDVSEKSAASESSRSYYWRIVDPSDYDIPASVPDGTTYKKIVNDNGDGTYDVIIEKDVSTDFSGNSYTKFGSVSGEDDASDSIFVSGTDTFSNIYDGEYELQGSLVNGYPWWAHSVTSTYTIKYSSANSLYELLDGAVVKYSTDENALCNIGWKEYSGAVAYDKYIVVEIGRPGRVYEEDSEVTFNDSEQKFVSDGGTVTDPVAGESKTIQNIPLPSGKYKTTVITRTAHSQRVPSMFGMLQFISPKYNSTERKNGIIVGKNRTQAEMIDDLRSASGSSFNSDAILEGRVPSNLTSVSISLTQFGAFDYTIMSTFRG